MRKNVGKYIAIAVLSYFVLYIALSLAGSYADRWEVVIDRGSMNAEGIITRDWHIYGTYVDGIASSPPNGALVRKQASLIGWRNTSVIPKIIYAVFLPMIIIDKVVWHKQSDVVGKWIS